VPFKLYWDKQPKEFLAGLEPSSPARAKAVKKALQHLQDDPRKHKGLNSQKHEVLSKARGEAVFESYAENDRPGAIRLFWYYGPGKGAITVFSMVFHP
jgi:hypothetical protein